MVWALVLKTWKSLLIFVKQGAKANTNVYIRVLIKTPTFEFSLGRTFNNGKYHKNAVCKILADLEKV